MNLWQWIHNVLFITNLNFVFTHGSILQAKDFMMLADKTFDDPSPVKEEVVDVIQKCIALCQTTSACKSYSYLDTDGSCILHNMDGESHPELLITQEGYVLADGYVPQKELQASIKKSIS